MLKAVLDDKYEIKVKDGFIVSEELNETLDSGLIVFNTNKNLNIESFDTAVLSGSLKNGNSIHEDNFPYKLLINNIDVDVANPFQDNEIRKYTIDLFSETKNLERITCPNLKITAPSGGVGEGTFSARTNPETITITPTEDFTNPGDNKTFTFSAPALVDAISHGWYILYDFQLFCQTSSNLPRVLGWDDIEHSVSWDTDNGTISVTLTIPDDLYFRNPLGSYIKIGVHYYRSVYYYIKQYVNMYSPKIHQKRGNSIGLVPSIDIGNGLKEKFGNIKCPEFQWNNPTLKEVLTDLMMVANCIPVIKRNTLGYIDLSNTKGDQIDKTKLNGLNKSQTSADYCSELTLPMSNSIGKNLVKVVEYIGFRNSDDYFITTDNLRLETQYPIYKIEKLTICGVRVSALESALETYREMDMTKYVYEKDVWDTLATPKTGNAGDNTKWGKVFFERGKNIIDGFSYTYKVLGITDYNYARILDEVGLHYYDKTGIGGGVYIRQHFFKIEYYTIDDRKLHIGKYLPTKHAENRIFDQQTSSYVDPNKMSMFEYFKVNRLGNMITKITATYTSMNDVPKLGDKLDDEILFSRKMQFKDECIVFEGYLTKNYILQDYFTSVMAKRRSWAFAKDSDALTRYEIDKYFLEFSYDDKSPYKPIGSYINAFNTGQSNNMIEKYMLTPFTSYTHEPIKYTIVKVYGMNTADITYDEKYYGLENNSEIMGNSIAITFGFNDNVSAGMYISDTDKYVCDIYKYVDHEAETKSIQYNLTSKQDAGDGDITWYEDGESLMPDTVENFTTMSNKSATKPLVSRIYGAHEILRGNLTLNKDNAEITKVSVQFEFCSDTKDIIMGKSFLERQKMVSLADNTISGLRLLITDIEPTINSLDNIPASTGSSVYLSNVSFTLSNTNNYIDISFNSSVLNNLSADKDYYAYIYDTSNGTYKNRVLLAFKLRRPLANSYRIYLNVLKTRDCNIYSRFIGREIIGNLIDGITNE